jgi:enamine deaminase RidA (YjgF/YER057c/UK114 family)
MERSADHPGYRMKRHHIASAYQSSRSYSPVVVTEGGRIIWLAGIIAPEDEQGRSLANDFDGQVRCIFRKMSAMLADVGATLADVVSMIVFITDVSNNTRMVELRKEFFKSDFPVSTLVTVQALNRPELMIEITATAVAE